MKTVFTDTSAWYALISTQDAHHAKARRFLESYTGTLLTSNYVAVETTNLIRDRLGTKQALGFLDVLKKTTLVELAFLTPQQHERSVELFAQYAEAGFSFTDCSSLLVIHDHRLELAFCFDADFSRLGVACVP